MNSLMFGITFSHSHLEFLGLDVFTSLDTAFTFGFSHIRLGAYWNWIERREGKYEFAQLHKLLNACELQAQPVVMTVGMKAPRWPEFYFPGFVQPDPGNRKTQEKALKFIGKTLEETKKYSCITHWQAENEPLDPSGPQNLALSPAFLKEEIELIRRLDSRPVIVNLWGNDLVPRGLLPAALDLADVIGVDIYYRQYVRQVFGRNMYVPPKQEREFAQLIDRSKKPVWITELQAEPWEKDNEGYLGENPGSISPDKLKGNLEKASRLRVKEILLWGFEYWLLRASRGDNRYLDTVRSFMKKD